MTSATDPGSGVRPVHRTSVTDMVTTEIRRSILSGALQPGQEFSLRRLAEQLGVSFIPVREALRRLESQGLVISGHGRSSSVAPLSHDDLHGIYRLRRALEPEIAARAAEIIDDAELDDLERVARSFGGTELGIDEVYESHHDFHRRLLEPAATQWDLTTLENLWRAAERYIRLAFGARDHDPREHDQRAHAHSDLIAAYRTREAAKVTAAVLSHLAENEKIAHGALT